MQMDCINRIAALMRQKFELEAQIEILKLQLHLNSSPDQSAQRRFTASKEVWLNINEVIEYAALDVTERTLQRWISQGKFPPKDGREGKWRKSDVDHWIDDPNKESVNI